MLNNNGQTSGQITAQAAFSNAVSLLNSQTGDRYLFSGRTTDTSATVSADVMLDGVGTQAGLKQLINERRQADQGVGNMGHLTVSSPPLTTTVTSLAEDGSSFGLKLGSVSSSLTGATVTQPTGAPPAVTVDLGAVNPNDGDKITFNFNLPDGTTESIALTATTTKSAADRLVPDRRRYGCDHREPAGRADVFDPDAGRHVAGGRVRDRGIGQFLQSVRDRHGDCGQQPGRGAGADHRRHAAVGRCGNGFAGRELSRPATPSRSTARRSPSSHPARPATSSTSPTACRRCWQRSIRSPAPVRPSTVTGGAIALHGGDGASLTVSSSNTAAFAALGFSATASANPAPLRVNGPPFATATNLIGGTSANTVSWYTGEVGTDPARGTAIARIDQSITVQYGARANEQALRYQLQNIAVYSAVTTNANNPNSKAQVNALQQRIAANLAPQTGQQSIQDMQAEFAGAQNAIKASTDRQTQLKGMAQTMLDQIEGINQDEVATKILALQTSLQASYQTTSMLYQTTLTKYPADLTQARSLRNEKASLRRPFHLKRCDGYADLRSGSSSDCIFRALSRICSSWPINFFNSFSAW